MRKTGWELPEPALQAEYKVQAHSWKELPGQREGAGPEPKVCAARASGQRGGEDGKAQEGRRNLFLHLQPLPQLSGGFSPALLARLSGEGSLLP